MKDTWFVIPTKKHEVVLRVIQEGHLRINKYKLRSKDTVYWPGLIDQLERLILNCEHCLKYSHSKCKQEPSMSLGQEVHLHPWSKLATDIFHFHVASYLLIVDYTSRFPAVHKLSLMTGQHIANQCKLIFSEYGWPKTLISDNGQCYTSEAFTSLMKDYSVNHITSSLHYQQFNRLAEKFIQIVKSLFYKAKEEGKYLFKCLMICCNTLLASSMKSQMQILQSRSARADLPMSNTARQQLGLQSEDLEKLIKINVCLSMATMLVKM